MPRTDVDTGEELQAVLKSASFGRIQTQDLFEALGIASATYHKRVKAADYPTAEEVDLIAAALDTPSLGAEYTAGALKVRFGLIDPEQVREMEEYLRAEGHPTSLTTRREVKRETRPRKSWPAKRHAALLRRTEDLKNPKPCLAGHKNRRILDCKTPGGY